jgi:hypothetical protein
MANNQLLASDNFASGSLAAGWSPLFGTLACQVVSHQTEPNTLSVQAGQVWGVGGVFGNDQSSEITIGSGYVNEAGNILALIVRQQAGALTYYQAQLINSTVFIYKTVAGASTQLAVLGGVVAVAGDVWVLQVAGSVLTLYQNNKFILNAGNADITGGTPGFAQFTTTNLAHNTVASWRGYNAIQQDGIWQKQGVVLAPIAGDLPSGIESHAPIIYEGNAQLLSGNVYKMWFDNFVSMYYAESLDGLTWTRKAAALLGPGIQNTSVFKFGSTYYCYVEQNATPVGPIQAFTSSDGINFTGQNVNAIVAGGGGAWDSVNLTGMFAMIQVGNTFYGFYGASKDLTTLTFSVGLAFSTDGINWVKYNANPILSNKGNFFGVTKVGNIFYAWAQSTQPGRGNVVAPAFDPVESIRYKSTDAFVWTPDTHSVHNTQMFESLNQVNGYCCTGMLINVAGKAYNYIPVGPGDANNSILGQIELAIAPVPIELVVTRPEDAIQQVASNSFTSGIGDLDSNWVTPTGATKLKIITGNLCEPTALATDCVMLNAGAAAIGSDQYSEITIATMGGEPDFCLPIVRGQTGAKSWYTVVIEGPTGADLNGVANIRKTVNNVSTQIGPIIQHIKPQIGDVFRLVATGSSPVLLSFYQNGFLIMQVEDWSNAFTTGLPGMLLYAQTTLANAQISLWAGGNPNIIPNYSPGGSSGFGYKFTYGF